MVEFMQYFGVFSQNKTWEKGWIPKGDRATGEALEYGEVAMIN